MDQIGPEFGLQVPLEPFVCLRLTVHRGILKLSPAFPADVKEPVAAKIHPRAVAEVREDGRGVAVHAQRWGCPPPNALQYRPRDAVALDPFPGEARSSVRRWCPIIRLLDASPSPFGEIEVQRPILGKWLTEEEVVAGSDGRPLASSVDSDDLDTLPGQPVRLEKGPQIAHPLLTPVLHHDSLRLNLDQVKSATPDDEPDDAVAVVGR